MEERTAPKPSPVAAMRSQRFRAGAVIVIAVIVGLVLWLALRGGDDSSSTTSNVTAATQTELENLAASVKHPIFWLGPKPGTTYELNRLSNGTINVRYLPSGVDLGTSEPHQAVATYPFPNAYQALKNIKGKDVVLLKIPNGGIAEYSKKYPQSVHAAYPGVDYQIEVFDPTPGTSAGLLVSGELEALGDITAGSAQPEQPPSQASAAELKSLVQSLGHPIYWVGPKRGYTYELRRATKGDVLIRYLPAGVKVGSAKPYLSVGTYPFPKALDAVQGLAKQPDVDQIELEGGGLAVVSKGNPNSIHLAYPQSNYQIEVYSPSAARARAVVTTNQVRPIG